jgi:hypothetical protein
MHGFYLVLLSRLVAVVCAALSGMEELLDERRIASLYVPIDTDNITAIHVYRDPSHWLRYTLVQQRFWACVKSLPKTVPMQPDKRRRFLRKKIFVTTFSQLSQPLNSGSSSDTYGISTDSTTIRIGCSRFSLFRPGTATLTSFSDLPLAETIAYNLLDQASKHKAWKQA